MVCLHSPQNHPMPSQSIWHHVISFQTNKLSPLWSANGSNQVSNKLLYTSPGNSKPDSQGRYTLLQSSQYKARSFQSHPL